MWVCVPAWVPVRCRALINRISHYIGECTAYTFQFQSWYITSYIIATRCNKYCKGKKLIINVSNTALKLHACIISIETSIIILIRDIFYEHKLEHEVHINSKWFHSSKYICKYLQKYILKINVKSNWWTIACTYICIISLKWEEYWKLSNIQKGENKKVEKITM